MKVQNAYFGEKVLCIYGSCGCDRDTIAIVKSRYDRQAWY